MVGPASSHLSLAQSVSSHELVNLAGRVVSAGFPSNNTVCLLSIRASSVASAPVKQYCEQRVSE